MFHHADTGNFVERTFDIGVVFDFGCDTTVESLRFDAFLNHFQLLVGQGDPVRVDSVVFRRVTDQCSPAAADVQKSVTFLQLQFATNHVELVDLSLFERFVPVAEVATAVEHLIVEEQTIEFIAHIVVKLDEVLIFLLFPLESRFVARIAMVD